MAGERQPFGAVSTVVVFRLSSHRKLSTAQLYNRIIVIEFHPR